MLGSRMVGMRLLASQGLGCHASAGSPLRAVGHCRRGLKLSASRPSLTLPGPFRIMEPSKFKGPIFVNYLGGQEFYLDPEVFKLVGSFWRISAILLRTFGVPGSR